MRINYPRICFLLSILFSPTTAISVYNLEDCFIRFQVPRAGQTTLDARVTQLHWTTTVNDVTNTILNFGNVGGTNAQLWMRGFSAMLYSGFATSECIPVNSQLGLDRDDVAVTVILPSGVERLQQVRADGSRLSITDNRATTGIFGIQGTLFPNDYGYTTGAKLREAIAEWKEDTWPLIGDRRYQPPVMQPQHFGVVQPNGLTQAIVVDWI
jgi:hypothetical protein